MKTAWLFLGAFGMCLLWPESAAAQGLIHQLPPDGTSVRYNVAVTRKGPGGDASNGAVEVTVSSVGVNKASDGDVELPLARRLPTMTGT